MKICFLIPIIVYRILILFFCNVILGMKPLLKILAVILLLFNGTGALYGGYNLMLHPDGSSISLPSGYIQHIPFDSYFIPGIILFICNGLFSFVAITVLLLRKKHYPLFIIAQGIILSIWIIVQVAYIGPVFFLQFMLGTVGLLLITSGLFLHRLERRAITPAPAHGHS